MCPRYPHVARLLLLLVLALPALAAAQSGINYGTLLGAPLEGAGSQLVDGGNGRAWVVSVRSPDGLGSAQPACAGARSCSTLELVDPGTDRIVRSVRVADLQVRQLLPLADGRLLLAGTADSAKLPHDPGLLWAADTAQGSQWLGIVGVDGQLAGGAYLRRSVEALHAAGGDEVIVVGRRSDVHPACIDINPGCSRVLVARVGSDLRSVRYDVEPLGGEQNSPRTSVLGSNGRLYVALAGRFEASTDAPFTEGLPEQPAEPHYSTGGLLVLDAQSGSLQRATYTRTEPASAIVYDAGRNAVWLQARSTSGQLPASADAYDSACGTATETCGPQLSICFSAGICIDRGGDSTLSRFSADASQLQYASYLGSGPADYPYALLLDPAGELYAAWSTVGIGTYTGAGSFQWLRLSRHGGTQLLGPVPTAAAFPVYANAPILSGRGAEIWSLGRYQQPAGGGAGLVGSGGLDPACLAPGTRCNQLARTTLPRGGQSAQVIPAATPPGTLLLLAMLAGLGLLRLRRG